MSNNFKYTMQKHRGKIWLGGSVLATAVVAGGVWLVVSEDSPLSETKEAVSYLADHAIMAKKDGQMELVKVDTGEQVGALKIDSATPILYQASKDHETLYAFNGDELFAISEEAEAISHQSLINGIGKATPSKFTTDGTLLAVYDEVEKTIDVIDIATKSSNQVKDIVSVKDMLVHNGTIYYLTESELVQLKDGEEKRIEVGDTLTSLQVMNNNLVVHSTFGEEKGENIVLYVNADTLDIENLQKTGAVNTSMLTNDDGEEYVLVGNFVAGETPSYLFNRYLVEPTGLAKDELMLRIPTESADTVFTAQNSVVDKDYIYVQSTSGLRVFDVKTQAFVHDIPVEVDYAMPIITEKEEGDEG